MVKKNLRNALATHQHHRAIQAHEAKVEAAKKRKEDSIHGRGGGANKKRKGRLERLGGLSSEGGNAETSSDVSATINVKGKQKMVEPFKKDDTILLVGEGDFSFTLSLLSPPHSHSPLRVLASSFDSEASCIAKYPRAKDNIAAIRALLQSAIGSSTASSSTATAEILRFNVDAGDLTSDKIVKKWCQGSGSSNKNSRGGFSKVWFGFPHVGQGHKDEQRNVLANQLLLLRFLVSAAPLLSQGSRPKYALDNEQGGNRGTKRKQAEESEEEEEPTDDIEDDEGFAAGQLEGAVIRREEETSEDPLDLDPEEALAKFNTTDGDLDSLSMPSSSAATWPPLPPPRAGSILISLRNSKPYTLWTVPQLGTKLTSLLPPIASTAPALPKGLKAPTLKDIARLFPEPSELPPATKGGKPRKRDAGYDLWRSFRFEPSMWKEYRHVRTIGSLTADKETEGRDDLLSKAEAGHGECRTWEFGLRT